MAVQLPGKPYHGLVRNGAYIHFQEKKPEIFHSSPGWYLSRKEVEDHSPSRRDGIDFKKETLLRKLYCSFLQDLGMKLKVPQVTIATSMIFCHRFYLRQSHAKNEWQEDGDQDGDIIQCYMKEHGVSEEVAHVHIKHCLADAWKGINQELCLLNPVPKPLIKGMVNFARVAETIFANGNDGLGDSKSWTKNLINSMFFEPIPM